MDTSDLTKTNNTNAVPGRNAWAEAIDWALWREAAARRLGKITLTVCPKARTACNNTRCILRPLCDCARANLAAARRLEARVWLTIAIGGAIALALVCWRSLQH